MTLSAESRYWAMYALKVDETTARVITLFEEAGIDVMLVKGPVIAKWLYPNEVRSYGDSDLLVARSEWSRAVGLLTKMGFSDYLGPMQHPRMESEAGTGFMKGDENVDLHATLPGLNADPEVVWQTVRDRAIEMPVGGRLVHVPDRAVVLAHIALHAIHDVDGKPLEDLRRAMATATDEEWRSAASVAATLDGLAAFSSGIRLHPDGQGLLERLDLGEERSSYYELRAARVPLAEGLDELMAPDLSLRERGGIVLRELFPNAEFMRWRSSLARRGWRGLLASYPVRWTWLAVHAPGGLMARRRIRRGTR